VSLPSVLSPASPQAREVYHLFWMVLGVASFIFAVVTGLVATNVIRFHRRPDDPLPRQKTGDIRLEILWTVVPLLILTALFVVSVRIMHAIQPPPGEREPDLQVTAHQWWWEGYYPKTGVTTANEFHLPVGQTLLLRFRSGDVIHDWWVPQLGRKIDIFPSRVTYLWTKILEPGTYLGTCDEFCGAEHAWMRIRVVADTPDAYTSWTNEQTAGPSAPTDSSAIEGLALYRSHTCASCHTIAGVSTGKIGPDLTHVASRETLAAGALGNTPDNMSRWIHNAQGVKPGCHMPDIGLTMAESRKIASYMESLK
jgi:cytochrome c oxidase subunit 2